MPVSPATSDILSLANSLDNTLKSAKSQADAAASKAASDQAPNAAAEFQAISDTLATHIAKLDQMQADYNDVARMNP